MATMCSLSQGERCAGTIALVGPVQLGDSEPSVSTTIAWQGVTVFPDPAPLSWTPTRVSSLRTYVG
jgi:hypothetical protein